MALESTSLDAVAERLRKVALGGLTALIVVRFFYASDSAPQGDLVIPIQLAGTRWVMLMLGVAILGVASMALARATRIRFSWADVAAVTDS